MKTLIFSNIYIALAAALLAQGTHRLLDTTADSYALMVLVFFATLSVYNLDRLSGASREDQHLQSERHRWIRDRRGWSLGLVALGICGVLGSAFYVQPVTLVALLPLGALSLGYCVPLLFRRRNTERDERWRRLRLKEIPGLKTFFVALVWAAATVLLPAVEAGLWPVSGEVWLVFGERWLFVFALTLPFDVRDIQRDRSAGIKTLTVMLGARRTMTLATVMMLLFTALTAGRYVTGGDPVLIGIAVSGVLTVLLLFFGRPAADDGDKRVGELYYGGWLDGMLLLQGLILWGF